MAAKCGRLTSGGYLGARVQSFLAWFAAKVEQKDRKDTQPARRVTEETAIGLVIWPNSAGSIEFTRDAEMVDK